MRKQVQMHAEQAISGIPTVPTNCHIKSLHKNVMSSQCLNIGRTAELIRTGFN